jgi:hypothetical protein
MLQKGRILWENYGKLLKLSLLIFGLAAMIIYLFSPPGFMIEWRESYIAEENLLLVFASIVIIGGFPFVFPLLAARKLSHQDKHRIIESILILLLFVMTIPFAPPIWSLGQSVALGIGMVELYF